MLTRDIPKTGQDQAATDHVAQSIARGRQAAFLVVGFLAGFLPLNTYWALGGTWGVGWVLGCADCTVPLSVVWIQEALVAAGIGVLLARIGVWTPQLPSWIWRSGTWTMAAAFAVVGAQNLLGDNTTQARLLFAPLALTVSAACTVTARSFARAENHRSGR